MQTKEKIMQIYDQYYELMYHIVYNILGNPIDSEDAIQEAFLRVAENISKISDPICPKTRNYIVIISRNIALNMLKKRKRMQWEELPLQLEDSRVRGRPEKVSEEREFIEMVRKGIEELPPRYRKCLYLSIIKEYTPKEIARMLGIKLPTIYKRLKRGKEKLQEKIKNL